MDTALNTTAPTLNDGSPTAAGRIYRIGTLSYRPRTLASLFGWLLWGDFCYMIFQTLAEKLLPLYLKDLHASNTLIGVMTGSIAGVFAIFVMPPVSMASDRYRGRLGRRIPFLLWATPGAVITVTLIGWAPEIGSWLHANVIPRSLLVSEAGVILSTLCLFIILYHVANMVLVNIFNALLRDVVPAEVMGRFVSLFRIVAALGSFVFSWFIFPYVLTERKLVCVGLGCIYMVCFLLMCWRVKEGAYDKPPPKPPGSGHMKDYVSFYQEFLRIRLYRNFLFAMILMVFATSAATPFKVLFARDSLGISMDAIGKIFAWSFLVGAAAYWPAGYLCDKFGAVRILIYGMLGYVIVLLGAVFGVHSSTGWLVYCILEMLPVVTLLLALNACMLELFAREKFAQFCSCLVVLGWGGGSIIGNYLTGRVIDLADSNYRVVFIWASITGALALVPMLFTLREWRKHGGPNNFVPPLAE